MSVFKNVAFGLRLRKLPKTEVRERAEQALEMVGLSHHIDSHPAQISGGEQQRVALARALVLEPEVLLLDEPLSNLDAKLRVRVREDIREIQQRVGITTVFVTHDQDEALSISDRIAVMNAGDVEQYADAQALYGRPATRFVADFIGTMNVFPAIPQGDQIRLADGTLVPCAERTAKLDAEAEVCVRPEDVRLAKDGAGPIVSVRREIPRGHYKQMVLEVGGSELQAFVPPDFPNFPLTECRLTFGRALVYQNDKLVE
jgi:ABC-type Fe3+/spermidine/putrescine transport system ATPase subunit